MCSIQAPEVNLEQKIRFPYYQIAHFQQLFSKIKLKEGIEIEGGKEIGEELEVENILDPLLQMIFKYFALSAIMERTPMTRIYLLEAIRRLKLIVLGLETSRKISGLGKIRKAFKLIVFHNSITNRLLDQDLGGLEAVDLMDDAFDWKVKL